MSSLTDKSQRFQYPWRENNRFGLLIDGTTFLPAMLDSIRNARDFVLLEMYLVESGSVVNRFITALLNAADRGVRIYVLLDDFGAIGLKRRDRKRLRHDNIQLVYYNRLRSYNTLYNLYRVLLLQQEHSLYRNHRKLLLVDGRRAYVGGTGLVDAFDPPEHPEQRWRETMVSIEGPVVADWQSLFVATWCKSTTQPLILPAVRPVAPANAQRGRVTVNQMNRHSEILLSLTGQIHRARRRVWFATAYFVPRWRIRRSLKRAARSGVDVRLLLPGPLTDHPAVRYISQRLYGRLMKNGVRIFEYQPRFLHAKCVLCDDWAAIGSANFDRWNLRWNLEANQEIDDPDFAVQVQRMFEQDFRDSVEYTIEQWERHGRVRRLLQWFWKRVELFSQTIGGKRRR